MKCLIMLLVLLVGCSSRTEKFTLRLSLEGDGPQNVVGADLRRIGYSLVVGDGETKILKVWLNPQEEKTAHWKSDIKVMYVEQTGLTRRSKSRFTLVYMFGNKGVAYTENSRGDAIPCRVNMIGQTKINVVCPKGLKTNNRAEDAFVVARRALMMIDEGRAPLGSDLVGLFDSGKDRLECWELGQCGPPRGK